MITYSDMIVGNEMITRNPHQKSAEIHIEIPTVASLHPRITTEQQLTNLIFER